MSYRRPVWKLSRFCLAGATAGLLLTNAAGAQTAEPDGRILFLGWTENREHSVWLSGTEPGEFFVVFPETGEHVDSWTQPDTGLHLTISPIVREYGGTHNLFAHIRTEFAEYDIFLDSADQRPGGLNFPNQWDPPDRDLPDTLTPGVRPNPDTLTPKVRPNPGTLTPAVRPNPDTLTPELRPIPDTLTPEVRPNPGTLTPEIRPDPGTLTPAVRPDPGTLTPEARPDPGTLTPEVRPDPGTLTPEVRPDPGTLTPELRPDPGTLTPGVRPDPDTLTPQVRPDPGALTPELRPDPGTLTPEVRPDPGTLTPEVRPNPGTLTPGVRPDPGTLTPEVRPDPGTLTPEVRPDPGTLTPELRPDPGTITPEVRPDPDALTPEMRPDPDTLTPEVRPDPGALTPQVRPDPGTLTPELRPDPDTLTPEVHPDPDPLIPGLQPTPGALTPGSRPERHLPRDVRLRPDDPRPMLMTADQLCEAGRKGWLRVDPKLVEQACAVVADARRRWTAWGEASFTSLEDKRSGGAMKAESSLYSVGLDRLFDNQTVAGLAIQFGNSEHSSFRGAMRQKAEFLVLKPYMVHRIAGSDIILDASLGFSFAEYERHVLMLSGKHDSFALAGTLGVSTQRPLGAGLLLRPRLALSYARFWHDPFRLQGNAAGIDLRVEQPASRLDYGAFAASLEISRPIRARDVIVTPFVEGGMDFAVLRPNEGRILRPDLNLVSTRSVIGSVRFGARMQVRRRVALVGSGEYYGIGSGGLSSWRWRASLSFRF